MTYNYIFVRNLATAINNNKNYFIQQIFPYQDKLKNAITTDISRDIYLRNGLRDLRVPVKDVKYILDDDDQYIMALVTFEDKFAKRMMDSTMIGIILDNESNVNVVSSSMFFNNKNPNDVTQLFCRIEHNAAPTPLAKIINLSEEAFAVIVDDYMKGKL